MAHAEATLKDEKSPWLTVEQAARRAQCGPKVVYKAIKDGKLKASKAGPVLIRVHQDWVDAWLNQEGETVNPDAPGPPHIFRSRRR